jgi:hypothetical protein
MRRSTPRAIRLPSLPCSKTDANAVGVARIVHVQKNASNVVLLQQKSHAFGKPICGTAPFKRSKQETALHRFIIFTALNSLIFFPKLGKLLRGL